MAQEQFSLPPLNQLVSTDRMQRANTADIGLPELPEEQIVSISTTRQVPSASAYTSAGGGGVMFWDEPAKKQSARPAVAAHAAGAGGCGISWY